MTEYERIDSESSTLVLAFEAGSAPRLVHFGRKAPANADLTTLDEAGRRGPRESTPDTPPRSNVFPVSGAGWMGEAALTGHHAGGDGVISWSAVTRERSGQSLQVQLMDERIRLSAQLNWRLDPRTGVLEAFASVTNHADKAFHLHSLASISLPIPDWAGEILAFSGDWSREMQPHRFSLPPGGWSTSNRTGRTGFPGASFALLEPGASDSQGKILAVHLAWSGNHRLAVETLTGGARQAIAGLLLLPGEVSLEAGETFCGPKTYSCVSLSGLNGVSDAFHPFVRSAILPQRRTDVRKVHFNSWEAAYFSFDETSLRRLADQASDLGAERFILDDGWFLGRGDDTSSLGDWRVDPDRFPNGLGAFIDHVRSLDMDFGLWVEPEMVSPDSDLYRKHPDWCVHAPDSPRRTMRGQLWLDMAREEVRDHLFEQIDALLREHDISCLKWDCNRFLDPAVSAGRPSAERIIRGSYALMDRLRAAHPEVDIESCASGGARIDLEVARRCMRAWTSDTTDAIERLSIQRWSSIFFPIDMLGAHVGPSPNPITGRSLPMDMRARVAMFGHMGIEADPSRMTEAERGSLKDHVALYKRHRKLLHSGRHLRWTSRDGADARLVISDDRTEALLLACRVHLAAHPDSAPVVIPGLAEGARYRVELLPPWPAISSRRLADQEIWLHGREFDAFTLTDVGLALPLSDPQTAWLVHLVRTA
jgi:alpha-galactosidase